MLTPMWSRSAGGQVVEVDLARLAELAEEAVAQLQGPLTVEVYERDQPPPAARRR